MGLTLKDLQNIPNAAQPTAGQGLTLDHNGLLPPGVFASTPTDLYALVWDDTLKRPKWAQITSAGITDGTITSADIADGTITRSDLGTVTRKSQPPVLSPNAGEAYWNDSATQAVIAPFAIPDDYVSGDLTFKWFRRGAATNTARMDIYTYRFRDATAFTTIESAVNADFTPGDVNSHVLSRTVTASNFQAGDIVRQDLIRLGADAGDTMVGNLLLDGCWVEYLGRA